MFGTARATHGGRTAVAIDEAIRRVLAERRRAREEGREIFPEHDRSVTGVHYPGEANDAGVASEEFAVRTERAEPGTWFGRAIRSTTDRARSVSDHIRTLIGPAGTYERGFILSAGVIVLMLTVLRLAHQTSPWYAIGTSIVVLASVLAPRLRQGVDMWRGQRVLQGRSMRQMLTCITCAPVFTWCAGPSLNRSTRAALWTSWLGIVGGTVALLGSM